MHSGSDQSSAGRARKLERDLRILQLDFAERPDHPFVLFNLGMTYENAGDFAAAKTELVRAVAECNGDLHSGHSADYCLNGEIPTMQGKQSRS